MTVRFFDEKGRVLGKGLGTDCSRKGCKPDALRGRARERTAALNHAADRDRAPSNRVSNRVRRAVRRRQGGRGPNTERARAREKDEGNEHFRGGRYADANSRVTPARSSPIDASTEQTEHHGGAGTGRDVAVCYANRAATRLMLARNRPLATVTRTVARSGHKDKDKEAKNSRKRRGWRRRRRGSRWRTAAPRSARTPSFTRARLRAGTCLVRLGAFAAAEAEFTPRPAVVLSGGTAELAGEASRARRAVDALRVETLPSLRRNAIRGVAEGAETARKTRRRRSKHGQNGEVKNGCKRSRRFRRTSVRRLAERTAAVVAPLRRLAPHCAVVAEAHARASLCVGAFAEATRAADEDGFGGAIEETAGLFDEDAVVDDDTASGPTAGSDVAGSNPASSRKRPQPPTVGDASSARWRTSRGETPGGASTSSRV